MSPYMHAQMIVLFIGKSTKTYNVLQYVIHPDGGQIIWRKKSVKSSIKGFEIFSFDTKIAETI